MGMKPRSKERRFILVNKQGTQAAGGHGGKFSWYASEDEAQQAAEDWGLTVVELRKTKDGWALPEHLCGVQQKKAEPVKLVVCVVKGVHGHRSLCLNKKDADSGLLIAGEKPWGGGHTVEEWEVDRDQLLADIEEVSNDE